MSHPLRLPWLPEAGRVVNVMVGRSHRMGVTDEGKLIKWEVPMVINMGVAINNYLVIVSERFHSNHRIDNIFTH